MHSPQTFPDRQSRFGLRSLLQGSFVELQITVGRARQRVRHVTGPVFLIGSSMDCDLILGDPLVPAVHSYILLTATEVRIRHLGFAPDLRVNGTQRELVTLQRRRLHRNQLLQFLGAGFHWRPTCRGVTRLRRIPWHRVRSLLSLPFPIHPDGGLVCRPPPLLLTSARVFRSMFQSPQLLGIIEIDPDSSPVGTCGRDLG